MVCNAAFLLNQTGVPRCLNSFGSYSRWLPIILGVTSLPDFSFSKWYLDPNFCRTEDYGKCWPTGSYNLTDSVNVHRSFISCPGIFKRNENFSDGCQWSTTFHNRASNAAPPKDRKPPNMESISTGVVHLPFKGEIASSATMKPIVDLNLVAKSKIFIMVLIRA